MPQRQARNQFLLSSRNILCLCHVCIFFTQTHTHNWELPHNPLHLSFFFHLIVILWWFLIGTYWPHHVLTCFTATQHSGIWLKCNSLTQRWTFCAVSGHLWPAAVINYPSYSLKKVTVSLSYIGLPYIYFTHLKRAMHVLVYSQIYAGTSIINSGTFLSLREETLYLLATPQS
jgi:hypothetical protein